MLPFRVRFRPGVSAYQQVAYAAKKAVVSGQLLAGDVFPSVRALSQEFKINPNTAHKVVSALVAEGLLEVRPGIGTVVANGAPVSPEAKRALLKQDAERLVVEAKCLSLGLDELLTAVEDHWQSLSDSAVADQTPRRTAKEQL